MRVPTASELLIAWERGLTCRTIQRALTLLALACPEMSTEELKELPIGQRDARLLELREVLFGQRLPCLTRCPNCREALEISFDIAQIRAATLGLAQSETCSLTANGYEVQFRLPNSSDLLSITEMSDIARARRILFERCVQKATRDEELIAPPDVPEEVVSMIATRMALMDPQADIQIALTCPACSEPWLAAFDITSYLWIEIHAWAAQTLHEVHRLASAYGWCEADILIMSPIRRRFYLEIIG